MGESMATTPHIMMIHPAMINVPATLHVATGASPSVPTAARVAPAQSVERSLLIFRNPMLGGFFFPSLPRPRTAFNLPVLISPTVTPNDQTLFDEPQLGGEQHYLPRYELAFTGSGNQTKFNVSLAVSSSGWLLTVNLKNVTPLTLMSNRKAEMPATRYFLQATLPDRTETWDFSNAVADSTSITLSMPITDPQQRDSIYTAMTDQSLRPVLILRRSPSLALPVPPAAPTPGQPAPQQLYRQSAVAIDTSIPFYFDKNLDQSVFANLPPTGSGAPSTLNRAAVPYPSSGTKTYPYWQDPLQPEQIYFLPDAYKIARVTTSPHTPAMSITTSGSDLATMSVTLTFLALPVWDAGRIAAAAAGPLLTAFSISKVSSLSILAATTTQLLLNLPSTDASASNAPIPVANATIDTANGIQGSITLSLSQFQQLYLAIFSQIEMLLSGKVNVTVGQDIEAVPFSGRASDFTGDIFDTTVTYDSSAHQVTVVVTNAIESPIQINALPVTLLQGTTAISSSVSSTSPTLPVTLQPVRPASSAASAPSATAPTNGSSAVNISSVAAVATPPSAITMVLQPATAPPPGTSYSVQFDLTQVTVLPDSQAILQAIVQNQTVAPVQKQIPVQLPAEVFPSPAATTASTLSSSSSPSSAGTAPLLAVQVVFQDGQTVTFEPSMTATDGVYTQTISLNVDITNYILGQGDSSNYTYRVDTITAQGTQEGVSKTTNKDDLFVTIGS